MIINGKDRSWLDLLQLPLSLVFTRFMNLFKAVIPYEHGYLPTDLLVLLAGIVLTGIGAAMTVDMQLIPNSGDGIVNSIARRCGRELGFTKIFLTAVVLLFPCLSVRSSVIRCSASA